MTDAIYFIDAIDDFDVIEVNHDFAAFDFLDTGYWYFQLRCP
jgi:hypothetical protein